MKNLQFILLLSLLTATLWTISARANGNNAGVYLRYSVGLMNTQKMNISYKDYSGEAKQKHTAPVVGLGIGYDFGNNLRMEGVFDYYFSFHHKETGKYCDCDFDNNVETKISDIALNLYKDFSCTERVKLFVGSGVGISAIQNESNNFVTRHTVHGSVKASLPPEHGKKTYRMMYRVMSGISYKIHDKLFGEISYNYMNLGKTRSHYVGGYPTITPRIVKIHGVTVGLRLYI